MSANRLSWVLHQDLHGGGWGDHRTVTIDGEDTGLKTSIENDGMSFLRLLDDAALDAIRDCLARDRLAREEAQEQRRIDEAQTSAML